MKIITLMYYIDNSEDDKIDSSNDESDENYNEI